MLPYTLTLFYFELIIIFINTPHFIKTLSMQSDRESALYSKYSQKTYNQSTNDPQGIQAMKKSIDSLYKKLNTPNETEEKIDESQTDQVSLYKETISTTHLPTQHLHKQNLTSKLIDCTYFSKQSTVSQFGQKSGTKKIQKPSTPTFHAQSSLNFLKNRKQQIIRNQQMGLTYDNLQILRKSMSKGSLQKSSKKSSLSKSNPKDFQLNGYLQKLNSMKNSNDIKPFNKFQRVRSVSQLSKIESILEENDQTSSKRSFLQRSRIKIPGSLSRAKSQTNSLRSSRTLSNQSQASKQSIPRQIRSILINSIASKIDESKFLKDIEFSKQKKVRRQAKVRQNQLEKRLQNFQKNLLEIERKNKLKSVKSDAPLETTKKQSLNNDFLSKLKLEIDNLTEELSELQQSKAKPSTNKIIQTQQSKILSTANQTNWNRSIIIAQRAQGLNLQSRSNNHVYANPGPLSSVLIHKPMQDRSKSHAKITFNYKSNQNGSSSQKFSSSIDANGQLNYSTENRYQNVNYNKLPVKNSSTDAMPSTSYHINSYQNATLNSNLNHSPNFQYPTNSFQSQANSVHHQFLPQNQQYSNQFQMVPQVFYHQNKTITLKNKHAIEAKRHSPLKGNEFHFMANNHPKNTFH